MNKVHHAAKVAGRKIKESYTSSGDSKPVWMMYFEFAFALFSTTALVVGSIYAYSQYVSHKENVQIQRTLNILSQLSDPATLRHIDNLHFASKKILSKRSWSSSGDDATVETVSFTGPDWPSREYYFDVLEIVKTQDAGYSIGYISNIFTHLELCVRNELCSDEVAISMSQRHALEFYKTWYPYICELSLFWGQNTYWLDSAAYYFEEIPMFCAIAEPEERAKRYMDSFWNNLTQ